MLQEGLQNLNLKEVLRNVHMMTLVEDDRNMMITLKLKFVEEM